MIKPLAMVTVLYVSGAAPIARDAGTPAPRAKTAALDAGTAFVDAGTRSEAEPGPDYKALAEQMKAQAQQLDELKKQLQAERDRTSRLEDRLHTVDGMTDQLGELISQVQGMRTDLQSQATARNDADARTQQHLADTRSAIEGLISAESSLAYGSSAIGAQLDRAQQVMTDPRAAAALQAARVSVANNDLQAARLYLYQAILDSQSTLINPK
jgi:chromosome segregation ATPase